MYNNTVNDLNICAGLPRGGKDSCQADSGGALTCKRGERHYAEGIVSTGYQCARPNAYGLYTDVSKMKAWIIKTIITGNNGKLHAVILL